MSIASRLKTWLAGVTLSAVLLTGAPAAVFATDQSPPQAAVPGSTESTEPSPGGAEKASPETPETGAAEPGASAPTPTTPTTPGGDTPDETGTTGDPDSRADADGRADAGSGEPDPLGSGPSEGATGDELATLLGGAQELQNRVAPASAAKLAPGTYTVTANPYVAGSDAPIGVNVYMADAGFPPVTPQKLNTTLRVAADGALSVDVPFNQEIFTLQSIADGPDLTVTEIERGGNIAWGNLTPDPRYPDRIVRVTASLGNDSGEYTFGGARQYPVPLQTEKTWDVHLSVDFASAVRQVTGDFTQTYRHQGTGAVVQVEAEAGDPLIPALTDASLRAKSPAADTEGIAGALAREFVSMPTFVGWELGLEGGDGAIALGAAQRTTVTLPYAGAEATVMRIVGGEATLVPGSRSADGEVTFVSEGLGLFALVETASAARWEHTKQFASELGTTMTYRTTGETDWEFPGMDFPSLDSLGAYSSFLGEEKNEQRLAEAAKLFSADFTDPKVRLFTFGLDVSFENVPGATVAKHWAWTYPMGGGKTSLSASVPTDTDASKLFLVSGTAGSGLTSADAIAAARNGSNAVFDIVAKDTDPASPAAMVQVPLWNAATGKNGDIDTAQTEVTEVAYIAVVQEAVVAVARPAAATGLTYDGTEQSGVPAGDGYTLSARPTATAAGTYLARATLLEGYVWENGSTAPLSLPWEIARAPLTATYAGESIDIGGAPKLAVSVTGFVAGETAATAAGFTAPTIVAPERLTAGGSYALTPAGGSATNYRFEYEGGTLRVNEEVIDPGLAPGSYRITANLFVPGNKNDILGLTAYMTNPKNPLVSPTHPNYGIPTAPVRDNATLVVGTDGSRSLVLDVPNPAFTLMQFGTASNGVTVAGVARDGKQYGKHTAGRIKKAVITLREGIDTAVFTKSKVYAAPLELDKTWDLSLAVDYASAVRVSDETTVTIPGDEGETPVNPGTTPGTKPGTKPGTNPGTKPGTNPGSKPGVKPRPTTKPNAGRPAVQPKQLAAGKYAVSSNIWFSREVTGLPLAPHITNGAFPPKDPVTDNATLTVAADGSGQITVPIVIQDRIMTVRSLSGGGVVSTGGSGAVTSVTVDLGHIDPTAASISRALTASVSIGDLAYSIGGPIFGGTREHTWPASFEVNLSGVPTSGGGIVPGFVQAKLPGARTADDEAALKVMQALEAAREANEKSKLAGRGDSGSGLTGSTGPGADPTAAGTAGTGAAVHPIALVAGIA
ncbi:MAG: hypothetical protein KA158_09185, partial [Leucobacter sp.]|nr:hypothetical protein [Leucobacter sp.]